MAMFTNQSPLFFAPALFLPFLSVIATLGSLYWTWPGTWAQTFFKTMAMWYAFIYVPLMDLVLGDDLLQPEKPRKEMHPTKAFLYEVILYAYVLFQPLTLLFVCYHISTAPTISPTTFSLLTLGCGVSNGILFTVAHELLHHPKRLDKFLATILLSICCYNHWQVSHLLHHVKVATTEDPSTARRNESIYAFIPRSIYGNILDGYGHERERRDRNNIAFFSIHNRALWWIACPSMIASTLSVIYGIKGLAFFVGQAAGGIVMLELVNYIEHYGLQRKQDPITHCYERVSPVHSWNATTFFSNAITFRLQRHSSHHADSSLPYYGLENAATAPMLPVGYSAMLLLSLYPPVFFRVMNGILDEYNAKKSD